MVVALLSWLGDIHMAVVVSVPCPLVLEVLLVVAGAVVLMSRWLRPGHLGGVLPEPLVDHGLLLHGINVHIMNGG